MITRDDIIKEKGQMEQMLGSLNGIGEKISDEQMLIALTNAVRDLQEFLIRKTWGI